MELELIYSPNWFFGKDIIIDSISIIVLILISVFAIRSYYYNKKNKNYLYLGFSFLTLALAYGFKILTNFTLHSETIKTAKIGFTTITYEAIKFYPQLIYISLLAYIFLTLIGLYILYSVYQKQSWITSIIITYLIILTTYFSRSAHYIFHITAFLLMFLVTYEYAKTSKKNKSSSSRLLLGSFIIITLSQALFVFAKIAGLCYITAELAQLIGYIGLLIVFIRILKNGKKTNKN